MEERNSNYMYEESRTGKLVPVLNGVYLHSVYDPEKEASSLIEKSAETLKNKNYVLVFGLGFGYHIDALMDNLKTNHKHFEIVVVEPNTKLIEDFLATRPIEDERVQILNIEDASEAYQQEVFIEFLMKKPCIIKHETSFSMNKDFFSNFLKFKAPKAMTKYSHLLSSQSKNVVDACSDFSLEDQAKSILENGAIKSKQEFLTLALNEVISQ